MPDLHANHALKKKTLNFKFLLCLLLSAFAAIGVITYGFKFPSMLDISNHNITNVLGVICATAAMSANIMLGTYSLLMMKSSKREKINPIILTVSLIGSVPYGFLCFVGYQKLLPNLINIILSTVVVLVNAGIGYTAIKGVIKSLNEYFGKEKLYHKLPVIEQFWRFLGLFIGIAISIIMFLATCDGITDLLLNNNFNKSLAIKIGYAFALLSWLPVAALFANANQMVTNELYQKARKFTKSVKNSSAFDFITIIFCLFSGTAIAQMMADSANPQKKIPELFKNDFIQFASHHHLVVIALFSSAALNYFSLNKLKDYFKE